MRLKSAGLVGKWSGYRTINGVRINDVPITGSRTIAKAVGGLPDIQIAASLFPIACRPIGMPRSPEVAARVAGLHPNVKGRIAPDAEYLSPNLQSYKIVTDSYSGLFSIKAYRQPPVKLHPRLQGTFMSYRLAHEALVQYLRTKDKPGRKSIWPGR